MSILIQKSVEHKFRICTLVTKWDQYENMKSSFLDAGFNENNSVFGTFDNSANNQFEPYQLLNQLFQETTEDYLILCHQDLLLDQGCGHAELLTIIDDLNAMDDKWAILGNAGCTDEFDFIVHISDPTSWQSSDLVAGRAPNVPQRVHSLDENFLLFKCEAKLVASKDISGFHLYGTDVCLHARLHGHNCYVVNFRLTHLSPGRFDEDFFTVKNRFLTCWNKHFKLLYIMRGAEVVLSKYGFVRKLAGRSRVRRLTCSQPKLRSLLFSQLKPSTSFFNLR